jgi:hypothetical protein
MPFSPRIKNNDKSYKLYQYHILSDTVEEIRETGLWLDPKKY